MISYKRYFTISLLLVCTLILIADVGSAMSLQVAPNRFVFRIDQRNTQEVMVTNVSDRPIRIKIYPEPVPGQNLAEYLGDWVVVYPRLIRLNPNEKKLVRFSVRTPAQLADGEYRSLLFFEELPVEGAEANSTEEMALNIQLLTKLGINLYGQSGQLDYRGELRDVKLALDEEHQLTITGQFANTGNAHLLSEVSMVVLDEEQRIVASSVVPLFVSHRSSMTPFQHQIPLPGKGGSYTLKIHFKQNDVMIHEYTRTFEIKSTLQ